MSIGARRGFSRVEHGHNTRGRVANAQQPALALREHLEVDGRLVEPRREPFELAQRMPLRFADGFPSRLDLERLAHRRARFFFRFTRRGEPALAEGRGASGGDSAPSPAATSRAFAGVRDDRLGGGAGLGVMRRVMIP